MKNMSNEIKEEIKDLKQKLVEKERESKEIEKAQAELEVLEKESKEIERTKGLLKDPDKYLLIRAYLRAHEFCKELTGIRDLDEYLVKKGFLTPIDKRKLYKGFVGFEKYNRDIVEPLNALLKSEGVE